VILAHDLAKTARPVRPITHNPRAASPLNVSATKFLPKRLQHHQAACRPGSGPQENNHGWRICAATRPGVRRISTPMVAPTLTARPNPRPNMRRRWLVVSDTIAALSVTGRLFPHHHKMQMSHRSCTNSCTRCPISNPQQRTACRCKITACPLRTVRSPVIQTYSGQALSKNLSCETLRLALKVTMNTDGIFLKWSDLGLTSRRCDESVAARQEADRRQGK
jgi:hypothetical protein